MSEEARQFRWDQGWRGPFVCAEFAARALDAGCKGPLHIQEASRELRCLTHCGGPTHCNHPEQHRETP